MAWCGREADGRNEKGGEDVIKEKGIEWMFFVKETVRVEETGLRGSGDVREQRKALICEFETLVLRCRDSQECERAAKDRQRQRGVTQEKDERAERQDRAPKK